MWRGETLNMATLTMRTLKTNECGGHPTAITSCVGSLRKRNDDGRVIVMELWCVTIYKLMCLRGETLNIATLTICSKKTNECGG